MSGGSIAAAHLVRHWTRYADLAEVSTLSRGAGDRATDTLIVSNAGSSFRTGGDDTYAGIVSRDVRASDILKRRVGKTVERQAGELTDVHRIDVRVRDIAPDPALTPATQQLLRLVRTDLDTFDRDLAGLLIDHGYRIGSARLTERGWIPAGERLPPAATSSDTALSDVAARRRHDPVVVPVRIARLAHGAAAMARDRASAALIVGGPTTYFIAQRARQANQKREQAQREQLLFQTGTLLKASRAVPSNDIRTAARVSRSR